MVISNRMPRLTNKHAARHLSAAHPTIRYECGIKMQQELAVSVLFTNLLIHYITINIKCTVFLFDIYHLDLFLKLTAHYKCNSVCTIISLSSACVRQRQRSTIYIY